MLKRNVILALCAFSFIIGCQNKPKPPVDFNAELPAGQLALRKISPGEYPNFYMNRPTLANLIKAADYSAVYLRAPSSQQYFPYDDIKHDRALATVYAFKELLAAELTSPDESGRRVNQAIRERFEVYKSIGAPNPEGGYTGKVLFTGYFTPTYNASLVRTAQFKHPLYKRPADLKTDAEGNVIGQPYLTRQEIESSNKLAGQELVYLASRWEAYVITVQGSARLRLTDGRILEVGYAGHNGYDYTSPGLQMIEDKVISKDQLSFKGLSAYFSSHPEAMDKYLSINKRYVFFSERPGGPFGSLNQPVSPLASIATDKNKRPNIYPRAMPAFLMVPIHQSSGFTAQFNGFMMDQDSGGAIRASGRCDIYMGIGAQAEAMAGHQLDQGELYYIAVKQELVPHYLKQTPAPAPVPVMNKDESTLNK